MVDFHGGIHTFYHVSEYLCGRPVATPQEPPELLQERSDAGE